MKNLNFFFKQKHVSNEKVFDDDDDHIDTGIPTHVIIVIIMDNNNNRKPIKIDGMWIYGEYMDE